MKITPAIIDTYQRLYVGLAVLPSHQGELRAALQGIIAQAEVYRVVESKTRVPWWLIGAIHYREADCNFSHDLAEGAPLPYGVNWEDSAVSALQASPAFSRSRKWTWDKIWQACYFIEAYNGFGYQLYHPETPSPYLWAGTNRARLGKYVADGKFDPKATDLQIGAMALIHALAESHAEFMPRLYMEPGIDDPGECEFCGDPIGSCKCGKKLDTPCK